jgi:hypothetical protein
MVWYITFDATPIIGSEHEAALKQCYGIFVCQDRHPDPEAYLRDVLLTTHSLQLETVRQSNRLAPELLPPLSPQLCTRLESEGFGLEIYGYPREEA